MPDSTPATVPAGKLRERCAINPAVSSGREGVHRRNEVVTCAGLFCLLRAVGDVRRCVVRLVRRITLHSGGCGAPGTKSGTNKSRRVVPWNPYLQRFEES